MTTPVPQILAEIIVSLFISPPTRKAIIDLLESFFTTFKSMCHPSVSSPRTETIVTFLKQLAICLRQFLRKLRKKKENKIYFNMNEKLGPSEDEIHKFLSMISELKIMNIQRHVDHFTILIETQFNPSTIDHYFDIAFQCINLMDAYDVSCGGWVILTSLVVSIEENEIFLNNFETIFEIAASNLYRLELQYSIANFFTTVALKIPFNKNDTAKGCEHFNFPKLAYSFFSNLISIYRTLPCLTDEISEIEDSETSELIETSACYFLLYSDNEVKNEILPILTSLATDEDIAHCIFAVESIVYNYCISSTSEQAEAIAKAAKTQLDSSNCTAIMFRFLAIIYSAAKICSSMKIETIKEVVDYILPYTKGDYKKYAWFVLSFALSLSDQNFNSKITLKSKIDPNKSFDYGFIDDFDVYWPELLDTSNLFYEVFNPVMDEFLTLKDPHKINNLLTDVKPFIMGALTAFFKFTEGQIEGQVNSAIIDPIHVIPQKYVKSVPFREKFIKCVIRIIKDFPENENLLTNIITLCSFLFSPYQTILNGMNISVSFYLSQIFKPMTQEKLKFNPIMMHFLMSQLAGARSKFIVIPVTNDIIELLTCIAQLGTTKFQNLNQSISDTFGTPSPFYYPLSKLIVTDTIHKASTLPFNDFINFLNQIYVHIYLTDNDELLCYTISVILNNLDITEKRNLYNLLNLMEIICLIKFPPGTPQSNNKECILLLNEIEEKHLSKYMNNRTYNHMLMLIIFMCLKRVYTVSDAIFDFIMKNITHFDQEISVIAEKCFTEILRRRRKFTKEKVDIKKFPKISDFPNILNCVTVKYKENGFYFPLTMKMTSVDSFLYYNNNNNDDDDDDDDDEDGLNGVGGPNINSKRPLKNGNFEEEEEEAETDEYSLDINPTKSLDMNYSNVDVDEDVLRVFETFKNITIEWNINDDNKIFDTEYFHDQANGYMMYKDHYYHKNNEFVKDKYLIKNIPNIFASAINSINERDLKSCINYIKIWKGFAMTVGPYCFNKLSKISIQYMSQYYALNAVVVARIFSDLICGFMFTCYEWNIEDRIKFIKQIALPIICILMTNPNTTKYADKIIYELNIHVNPISFAPLIKILCDLSPSGPNIPVNNRYLVSIFSKIQTTRPYAYFGLIDQMKAKFVDPFIARMSEYNLKEVCQIIDMVFSFLHCSSLTIEKSPLHSNEIELAQKKSTEILNQILSNKIEKSNELINCQNIRKILIQCLTSSFCNFNKSTYELRFLVASILIENLNLFSNLLKGSLINNEIKLINDFSTFMQNNFFMTNTKFELKFLSIFVNQLKKLSFQMQMLFLQNINTMIEYSIFNISLEDISSYEKIFIDYDAFVKSINFGTVLRMEISKILGNFEIRNSSFNSLIKSEVTDHDLIEELVLKAGSIILNSYLFDHADEKVTNAFNFMDEHCTTKNSKNKEFFKKVTEIFINRHSGQVLNEVEDLLIQYKSLLTPSYFS